MLFRFSSGVVSLPRQSSPVGRILPCLVGSTEDRSGIIGPTPQPMPHEPRGTYGDEGKAVGCVPLMALLFLPSASANTRYRTLGWRLARERIGELLRENYRVDQEMSPRLAALIKKIENGSPELSTEMVQVTGEKQDD
jgi:hypothetical protein